MPGKSSMRFRRPSVFTALFSAVTLFAACAPGFSNAMTIKLSEPSRSGAVSFEETIARRRTIRSFFDIPLSERQVSQLLWAAGGITEPSTGKRSAPSAGALYPLEIYLVMGNSAKTPFKPGVYHYRPHDHSLAASSTGTDLRSAVGRAALGQMWMAEAPAIFLITADFGRTTVKYKERGLQYVHQEAGCAAENLMLQAQALDLGVAIVGAFFEEEVGRVFSLPDSHHPLLLLPVGPTKGDQ